MNATLPSGFAYDAIRLFDFDGDIDAALPDPEPGFITIRYGGWSLQELRDNPIVRERNLMWEQRWYNLRPSWSAEKLPAGIYRLRIPVPNSNQHTYAEQVRLLPKNEEPAPVVLVANALLAHSIRGGCDLLKSEWTRCKDWSDIRSRVVVRWNGGRLVFNSVWGDLRDNRFWLSSVRTS